MSLVKVPLQFAIFIGLKFASLTTLIIPAMLPSIITFYPFINSYQHSFINIYQHRFINSALSTFILTLNYQHSI